MRYDILKRLRPRFNDSKKTQKGGKILLSQTSKTGTNRSFRCFFPYLALTSALQSFSNPSRKHVAKTMQTLALTSKTIG